MAALSTDYRSLDATSRTSMAVRWAEPDEDVHTFSTSWSAGGTYLLGRRMYEVLAYWDDPPALDEQPSFVQEFAEIWQAADKVVYSRTLETARTARTRIERAFDPEAIRQLKAQSDRDVTVGGPDLAAQAIGRWSTTNRCRVPVVVGAGSSPCRAMAASSSNCWTNAGSAWQCFFTTAPVNRPAPSDVRDWCVRRWPRRGGDVALPCSRPRFYMVMLTS